LILGTTMLDWEKQLENLIKLAQSLPWSVGESDHDCNAEELMERGILDLRQKIFQGLSQYLLEHIIMTSIISNTEHLVSDKDFITPDTINNLLYNTIQQLKGNQTTSGIELVNLEPLVYHYIESLSVKSDQQASSSSVGSDCLKNHCHWSMGCPAVVRDHRIGGSVGRRQPISGLTDMLKMEIDHYTPKSRVMSIHKMEKLPGLKLCRLHNIYWKKNLMCYGLPQEVCEAKSSQ